LLMAKAFPASHFVGYDYHAPSIEVARQRAREAGLHNATFEQADATSYYAAASRPRFRSATNRR